MKVFKKSAPLCVMQCVYTEEERKGVSYYLFPHDKDLLAKWIQATGIPDVVKKPTALLCSNHFEQHLTKPCLRKDAVPTIFRKNSLTMVAPNQIVANGLPNNGEMGNLAQILSSFASLSSYASTTTNSSSSLSAPSRSQNLHPTQRITQQIFVINPTQINTFSNPIERGTNRVTVEEKSSNLNEIHATYSESSTNNPTCEVTNEEPLYQIIQPKRIEKLTTEKPRHDELNKEIDELLTEQKTITRKYKTIVQRKRRIVAKFKKLDRRATLKLKQKLIEEMRHQLGELYNEAFFIKPDTMSSMSWNNIEDFTLRLTDDKCEETETEEGEMEIEMLDEAKDLLLN